VQTRELLYLIRYLGTESIGVKSLKCSVFARIAIFLPGTHTVDGNVKSSTLILNFVFSSHAMRQTMMNYELRMMTTHDRHITKSRPFCFSHFDVRVVSTMNLA
jgi:hypothetical protein